MIIFSPAGGGPAYTGPLDLVPGAVVAYGQRAMAAAWVSNAITIRRDSDDATQSFATTTSNAVDAAAISAFIGAGAGTVVLWNDQSGGAVDFTPEAEEPTWLNNIQNSKPGLAADGGAKFNSTIPVTLPNGAYTVFIVSDVTMRCGVDTGEDDYVEFSCSDNGVLDAEITPNIAGGTSSESLSPGTIRIFEGAWEFGVRSYLVDGVPLTMSDDDDGGPLGSITGLAYLTLSGIDVTQRPCLELLIYPVMLSLSARNDIRENIAAYYGITLS